MAKPYQNSIVDEILSKMPLEERISLANMKEKDVEVLQGCLIYISEARLILKMRTMNKLCMNYGQGYVKLTG
jgi:hypothetical protein